MSIFDDHTGDILDGLRNPAWELPDYEPNGAANPKGDAAYWRARAEKAEAGWRNCIDLHCEAEARAEAAEAEAARMREENEKDDVRVGNFLSLMRQSLMVFDSLEYGYTPYALDGSIQELRKRLRAALNPPPAEETE